MGQPTPDQIQEERTKRLFVMTLGSALGVDQSYAEQDMYPVSPTGQYQVYGSTYGFGVEGQPVSQASQQANLMPLFIVVGLGIVAWALAR
jgi:hypothetical protein